MRISWRLIVLALILCSCAGPKPRSGLDTDVTRTLSPVKDIIALAETRPLTTDEAVALQIKYDDARAKISASQDDLQAEMDRAERAAAVSRRIQYALGTAGLALLIGGGLALVASFWIVFIPRKVAAGVAVLGLIILGIAARMETIGLAIDLFLYGVLGIIMVLLLVMLWVAVRPYFITRKQAAGKRELADQMASLGDHDSAKVLIAEAGVLEHVGKRDYNATRIEPGDTALRAMKGEVVRGQGSGVR